MTVVVNAAQSQGMKVNAVAASRPVCANCPQAIQDAGARQVTPSKPQQEPIVPTVEPQVFLNGLERQLLTLSHTQQLAFGTMCCDRHLADYLRFSADLKWGDPDALKRAINLAWATVADGQVTTRVDLDALLANCVDATPDSDDFPRGMSDYAQDAAIMVCHLIEFLKDGKIRSIVQIASKARDLIDARVQIKLQLKPIDPDLEVKIASDPEIVVELSALDDDLKLVGDENQLRAILQSRRPI
jgi:uncharacterized protein YjaG (DUF416 family)